MTQELNFKLKNLKKKTADTKEENENGSIASDEEALEASYQRRLL